jgi:hypothetical protein
MAHRLLYLPSVDANFGVSGETLKMRQVKKAQRTKASSKGKPAQDKPSQPDVASTTEELKSSSGELASTLGDHRAGVIESHHHAPGGHGPDPDGSEVVDAAGDLHSDDRDVDDSESAIEAAVDRKAGIADIENVGRIPGEDIEDIEETERSFLDEPATEPDPPQGRRRERHQSA